MYPINMGIINANIQIDLTGSDACGRRVVHFKANEKSLRQCASFIYINQKVAIPLHALQHGGGSSVQKWHERRISRVQQATCVSEHLQQLVQSAAHFLLHAVVPIKNSQIEEGAVVSGRQLKGTQKGGFCNRQ